jgi:hypothetical protein
MENEKGSLYLEREEIEDGAAQLAEAGARTTRFFL